MSRPTSARVAGSAFLIYIAAGMSSLGGAPGPLLHIVLSFGMCFSAFTLGVTLFAVTCDQDREIAMMGMVCRVAEGIVGIMFMSTSLAMRSALSAADGPDGAVLHTLNALLSSAQRVNFSVTGMLFAAGSTMFCWLLLRGRTIPVGLAWLGLLASVLLVLALPLQLARVLTGRYAMIVWAPMAAFEIPTGIWLIVKGVSDFKPGSGAGPARESPQSVLA